MNERLGILFLHHTTDPVVLNNLRSIRDWNPGATVVTMSAGEPLPGGCSLARTPDLQRRHAVTAQTSADLLVCSWYLQKKTTCDRWWIVEWDTFCTVSAREYYAPVWEFPFVASSVQLLRRSPGWYWFEKRADLPASYQPHVTGAVPFLYLLSEKALDATCELLLSDPTDAGNSELRFATAANRAGFPPCGYSPPGDRITWMLWPSVEPSHPAVFHPVKHVAESALAPAGKTDEGGPLPERS